MIISEKLLNELQILNTDIENILVTKSLTTFQLDTFFKSFEKRRYNILSEIKLYNKNIENEYEKISFKFSPFRNRFSFTPDWTCYIWCKTWYDFNNVVYSYDIK